MEELKCCPFCGSEDTDDSYALATKAGDDTVFYYGVGCNNCGCQTETMDTKAQAIKAWNKRANSEGG